MSIEPRENSRYPECSPANSSSLHVWVMMRCCTPCMIVTHSESLVASYGCHKHRYALDRILCQHDPVWLVEIPLPYILRQHDWIG